MAKTFTPDPYAAAVILARQQAHRLIVRQVKAEGRVKLSTLTYATLSRLAIELVEQCPALVEKALADLPPVQPKRNRPQNDK
jgi:hypothetical protein